MNWFATKILQVNEWAQLIIKLPILLVWGIILLALLALVQAMGLALGKTKPNPSPSPKTKKKTGN